jgi:hypothetical protein
MSLCGYRRSSKAGDERRQFCAMNVANHDKACKAQSARIRSRTQRERFTFFWMVILCPWRAGTVFVI